ncbi:DegT/DnrJ/EryC1/StrS family aminotransferase [Pedobacter immunditicola]|uniref:DegT/DnrJ/EryC1/StrS family aminotransferase n=1 Tax=Pedobacter immunditicola TaxID=3133440 RepID=UPI0030B42606
MDSITSSKKIPCLDLKEQHHQIKNEVFSAFEEVYDHASFSGGVFVQEFEQEFAKFCKTNYTIGVNNGTSALHLSMLALNIGIGDEVIVPANTFIATAWGVTYTGATPVFVDCTGDTWQLDINLIEDRITTKTKAIIGVHLYGQPFDIDSVKELCEKYNLHFIEDAAQAHGAKYKGIPVGSFGEMACFSFYPGKNLGACGEAGGITTNYKSYYDLLLSLRNHGSTVRYYHDEIGFNMRMGGLEAASLKVKLKHLTGWNDRRKAIAGMYLNQIINPKITMQKQPVWADSVYHLFVITTAKRDELISYLNEKNITAGLHYPVPCHLQKAYSYLNYKNGDCPQAEYLANHCLSLPMYAELTDEEIVYIIEVLNSY